jgi:hypothetical protein
MFHIWRTPDHISRFDFLCQAFPFMYPADTGSNENVLPCRMNVPRRKGLYGRSSVLIARRSSIAR